jgi:predicted dithiol-disulfide oxidoreductase (DUF899 family)
MMNTAYHYPGLTPKGRGEAGLEFGMAWVRYHDKYDAPAARPVWMLSEQPRANS